MRLPIYQVDAFAEKLFGGNPAAICPLTEWLPDATMQAIAAENNLAETAFFVREGADYALRWFTPAVEVDLCGHATLASAHVVFAFLEPERATREFPHAQSRHAHSGAARRYADDGFPGAARHGSRAAAGFARSARRFATRGFESARPRGGLWQRRGSRGAEAGFCGARQARLLGRNRHRAGRGWHRFRLALLRAAPRHRRKIRRPARRTARSCRIGPHASASAN